MALPYTDSPFVATIMANPARMPLTEAEIGSVVDALAANGGIVNDVKWLARDRACDVFFAVLPLVEARELLSHLLANVPFDFVVQANRQRRKKMLICDMDSTIIEQECIDEMADMLGLKEKISAITHRAMNGEIEFKEALRERVALLKGLSEQKLQEVFDSRITIMPGARELVATMRSQGARAVLVSGGFTFFTRRVRDAVGFDMEEANILEIKEGVLTGTVKEPILDKQAKLSALKIHAEELKIPLILTLAAGDGANDLPMLQSAGLGVAYHAKPHVKTQSQAWVDVCDLTALLYVQGYAEHEIVTGSSQ